MNLHAITAIAKQQRDALQRRKEQEARAQGRSPLSRIVTQAQKQTHELWSPNIAQLSTHTVSSGQNPDGSWQFLPGWDAPPTPKF